MAEEEVVVSHVTQAGNPTAYAKKVLAHMVVDPDAWWAHAKSVEKIDEVKALNDKVERWKATYDAAVVAEGKDYKDRVAQDKAADEELKKL